MISVTSAHRRYLIGISLVTLLFFVSFFGAILAIRPHNGMDPALITALKLSPIGPILLYGAVTFLYYRRLDEYHRVRCLKVLALLGCLTFLTDMIWNIAETVGAPPLGAAGLVLVMADLYCVITFLFRLEEGVAQNQIGTLSRYLCWLAIPTVLVVGGFAYFGLASEPALVVGAIAVVVLIITSVRIGMAQGPSTGLV